MFKKYKIPLKFKSFQHNVREIKPVEYVNCLCTNSDFISGKYRSKPFKITCICAPKLSLAVKNR